MNKELTELVFILDRSGSMGGLESDTIGGFNGMIERQKKEKEKVNVTTILFDDEVEIIHDHFLPAFHIYCRTISVRQYFTLLCNDYFFKICLYGVILFICCFSFF